MVVASAQTENEPTTPAHAYAVFERRGWLATAPVALRAAILGAGRLMHITRGQRLYAIGSPPGGIYGVLSGGVALEASTQWHAPRLGHIHRAGHWFGHTPALEGSNRTIGVIASESSQLLNVPLPALRQLMQENAEITRLVGGMASIASALGTWVGCDLLIPDAPRRIAAVLLRITGALEGVEPDDPSGFVVTQAELGDMANASRNHVNRVLGSFVDAGWIEQHYSHVLMRDVAALKAFAFAED